MSKSKSKTKAPITNIINHIALVLDGSSSMSGLQNRLVKVVDDKIKHLAVLSNELGQETRVTIYLFSDSVKCLVYDKDVLRLPSIVDLYYSSGMTALMDATGQAISDLKKVPELYGEHSFLMYVLTDGEENASRRESAKSLSSAIRGLPSHWTVAALVPDASGKANAQMSGFPPANVAVWTATEAGMSAAGDMLRKATDNFMRGRATGVRGTTSLFEFDVKAVTKKAVKATCDSLPKTAFKLLPVRTKDNGVAIKDFVESKAKRSYSKGCAFYQLTKRETIQDYKAMCLQDNITGDVYTGDGTRDLLGLPDHEIRVQPANHPKYTFFVQSTSVNRKLVAGTQLLVMTK